jgi:hypothetical protein
MPLAYGCPDAATIPGVSTVGCARRAAADRRVTVTATAALRAPARAL